MHNYYGATASPTFDNVQTADGGWVMDLTVTNYGTTIVSAPENGAHAKIYTNFQFISFPTDVWNSYLDMMPINTDYWTANNWDASTQTGFVW